MLSCMVVVFSEELHMEVWSDKLYKKTQNVLKYPCDSLSLVAQMILMIHDTQSTTVYAFADWLHTHSNTVT